MTVIESNCSDLYYSSILMMLMVIGRARKPDAEYLLVTERGRGTAQRDEINRMREDLMNDAIRRIDVMNMTDFRQCVEKHQKDAKLTRNLTSLGEKMQKDQRRRRPSGGLHRLLCVKCSTLVCLSIDIRRVEEVHHVVIDDKLKSVARYMEYRSPVKFGEFDQRGKLKCRNCDQDWGVVARYSKVLFPVLKLANFVLEDECNQRKCYKQWKKVPFTVSELTEEDMQNLERNGIQLVPLNY